jgi:hypothetical protein
MRWGHCLGAVAGHCSHNKGPPAAGAEDSRTPGKEGRGIGGPAQVGSQAREAAGGFGRFSSLGNAQG